MIELLIGIAIFSIVILIALEAFTKVINYNRKAAQNQGIQDHAEFIFQVMSREIRTAKINYSDNCKGFYNLFDSAHPVGPNQVYSVGDTGVSTPLPVIFFENANSECVAIGLKVDASAGNIKRLSVARCAHQNSNRCNNPSNKREAYVTPQDIEVLKFTARATNFSNLSDADRHRPGTISYYMKLKSFIWDPPEIEFTNFITARNGEQF
jgi:type II secretory pathway pseudopilin PulG